jgi:hypothetical protein
MSLFYHPLRLVDMSISVIAVHRGFALSVPLQHGSELIGCLVAAELVSGLQILNQPIDHPEGAALSSDRSCGPRWASSPASTPTC